MAPRPAPRAPPLALAAAVALALVFAALVATSPPWFLAGAVTVCVPWLLASARATPAGTTLRGRPADLALGLLVAVVLYVGARLVLWAACGGLGDVLCAPMEATYARFPTRSVAGALVVGLVVAPAEEAFWRGVVQGHLVARLGPARGVAATVTLAVAVALASGEPFLALATLPTYAVWGALATWRGSLLPAVVSHAAWTLAIASVLPAR